MSQLQIVNFHYISNPKNYEYPGIHPIAPNDFANLVDQFITEYHMATPDQVAQYAEGYDVFDRNACFLTFDDGLKEHGHIVRRTLNERGIKSAFFVPSRPLGDGKPLTINATHWLRATTEPSQFESELYSYLSADERSAIAAHHETAGTIYTYDTPAVAGVKYLLTYLLSADRVEMIVSQMLEQRNIETAELLNTLYMSAGDIQALAADGHEVGLHGRNHRPMAQLTKTELDTDIHHCAQTLVNKCEIDARWLAYPYGNRSANPAEPSALLARHNLTLGFTLTKMENFSGKAVVELSRLNPNDLLDWKN